MPSYYGSKQNYGLYQNIINVMPPHANYYELFLGSGAILCNKRPAPGKNVGVELIRSVIDKFNYPSAAEIVNACAIKYLKELVLHAGDQDLIYIDPPYEFEVRTSQKPMYKNELTKAEHEDIAQTITAARARVIISTYPGSVYENILQGWNKKTFVSYTRRHQKKTEVIYFNYPVPDQLMITVFWVKTKPIASRSKGKLTA